MHFGFYGVLRSAPIAPAFRTFNMCRAHRSDTHPFMLASAANERPGQMRAVDFLALLRSKIYDVAHGAQCCLLQAKAGRPAEPFVYRRAVCAERTCFENPAVEFHADGLDGVEAAEVSW